MRLYTAILRGLTRPTFIRITTPLQPKIRFFSTSKLSTMKRLIFCCDGTWQNSDQGTMKSPTNITLLSRTIKQRTDNGTEQIVVYQPGIGTNYGWMTRVAAGAFGEGLLEDIREAYGFIVHNWMPGDEIYLFGFSRGAYTARATAGIICKFGLLTKRGMDGIGEVLDAYGKHQLDDPTIVAGLAAKYERRSDTPPPIKFVGVWDTVGSLGIPDLYILGMRATLFDSVLAKINQKYEFANTDLHPNIEFAFHALALNEHRAPFTPTLWKLTPDNTKSTLQQCWFPGDHSTVGGGDPTHGISDITLAWMVQKLSDHTDLEYDPSYLLASRQTFGVNHMDTPWGCEIWPESFTGIYTMAGVKARTPGEYLTGKDVGDKTNESFHLCIKVREEQLGTKFTHPSLGTLEQDVFGDVEKTLAWPPVGATPAPAAK